MAHALLYWTGVGMEKRKALAAAALSRLRGLVVELRQPQGEAAHDDAARARDRAEAALATALSYLEAAPGAMLVVEEHGRITVVNSEAERLFGYSREELIGAPVELLLPESKRPAHAAVRSQLQARPHRRLMTERGDLHARCKDGSLVAIEVSLSPVRTEPGADIVVSVRDVSAQRASERELERLNNRLQLATHAGQIGTWEWDIESTELTWDPVMHALYGVPVGSKRSGVGLWWSLLAPDCVERVGAEVQRALEGTRDLDTDFLIKRADGQLRVIAARAVVQRDEAGKPLRMLGTNMDITDRRRAETKLANSEQLFRSAMEHSAIGMALVDLDGRWLKVNRNLCELLGYPEQELYQLTFQQITHPEDLARDLALAQQLRSGEVGFYRLEKRYVRKDGRVISALLTGSAARDESGEALYYIAQIQDITEQKAAESQLRESLAEKEVLLREIHHRVKNNLQIIISILRLQSHEVDDAQRAMLSDCQARIQTMALLHERLHRGGRLSAVDFGEHLRELTSMLLRSFHDSTCVVTLELAIESVSVDIDAAIPLGLLANELITNALKHAFVGRSRGTLSIELAKKDGVLRLCVADDGVGFRGDFAAEARTSLGFRLIRALAHQLRAVLQVSRTERTAITLTLQRSPSEDHEERTHRQDA